ncbi:GtrA family protein [Geodermatophilus sp. SYSU D00758]
MTPRDQETPVTCPSLLCRRQVVGELVEGRATGPAEWVVEQVRGGGTLGQFLRFVLVGGSTTVVYAALFVALGWLGYLPAHVSATVVSTILANELHRRLTFRADERVHWFTAQWEAGGVTVVGLMATSAALGWLDSHAGEASVVTQVTLVVCVTAAIGLMRFVALRWLFRAPAPDAA